MNHHRICGVLLVLTFAFVPSSALADLIVATDLGSSLTVGPANTVVTIHENAAGSESGCTTVTGALLSCLNNSTTHVAGGDNIGINNVLTFNTSENLAAVVTSKTAARLFNATLTDLYLTFDGANGSFTTEYLGPDLTLSSEFALFELSATDFGAIQALGPFVVVSGGLSFLGGGGANAGPEALHIVHAPTAREILLTSVAVPEPATLPLISGGLMALMMLRHRYGRRHQSECDNFK
jgi:hypothetical protein